MSAPQGWCKLEHKDGRVGSTRMCQSAAGAVLPAWKDQCGFSKVPVSPSPPSTPVSSANSSSPPLQRWGWDNTSRISGPSVPCCTGARLSPTCKPFAFLVFFFFFLLLQNQFTDSSLIFPPCKLISYSAPASTRKHPLSQGGLETPSLAVITLSSLTASQPAYKTFPFSPARGCPASQKKRKYSNISSPTPPAE